VQRPGGDAAVVRVHGTGKALAISTDVTPRYCYADPYEGGKQAIAECYRNLSAVGAKPLAVTNCLNFANPQRPEIMAQLVGCLEGMSEACRALDFPIVSGNVSLYNESKATGGGSAILPTPAIGGIGLLEDYSKSATIAFKTEGEAIFLIGETRGHLGQSLWLREIAGREEGPPPPVDLSEEQTNGEVVRSMIPFGYVSAVHDLSDGGLLVGLAEMALAGNMGASLDHLAGETLKHWSTFEIVPLLQAMSEHAWYFGEDQGRYLVSTSNPDALAHGCGWSNMHYRRIGTTGGNALRGGGWEVPLAELRRAHEGFFPKLMGKELAVA
jgi:phosphoribosylformylglycinamidine synthase